MSINIPSVNLGAMRLRGRISDETDRKLYTHTSPYDLRYFRNEWAAFQARNLGGNGLETDTFAYFGTSGGGGTLVGP